MIAILAAIAMIECVILEIWLDIQAAEERPYRDFYKKSNLTMMKNAGNGKQDSPMNMDAFTQCLMVVILALKPIVTLMSYLWMIYLKDYLLTIIAVIKNVLIRTIYMLSLNQRTVNWLGNEENNQGNLKLLNVKEAINTLLRILISIRRGLKNVLYVDMTLLEEANYAESNLC